MPICYILLDIYYKNEMQTKGNISIVIMKIKYMIEFIFVITLRQCFIVQLLYSLKL